MLTQVRSSASINAARPQTRDSGGKNWPWLVFAAAVFVSLAAFHVCWGQMTQDEGFFALAARNVLHGMKPYRDFLFLQMPLLPYVYACWFAVFDPSILAGRILSAIFGAASVGLIGLACHYRGGRLAGVAGSLLVACNLSYVFDTCTFKTQSLTLFLTSLSLYFLSRWGGGPSLASSAAALFCMTLAFLTRLSILPALLFLWAYVGLQHRRQLLACGLLLGANLVLLVAAIGFFYSQGNMFFGTYQFHQEFFGFPSWTWARLFEVWMQWLGNQLPMLVLFAAAMLVFVGGMGKWDAGPGALSSAPFCLFLLLSYWGGTGIHWLAVQSHATHQTSLTAFAAVFSMSVLAPALGRLPPRALRRVGFTFLGALLLAMPLQQWEVRFDGSSSLGRLQDVAALIRRHASPGDSLLSFNAELAVEANLRVPWGYEMSEFTYFPTMSDERCAQLKTTNFNKLVADLGSGAHRIFCVGKREFSMMSCDNQTLGDVLSSHISANFRLVGLVTNYGQFSDEMRVYVLETP